MTPPDQNPPPRNNMNAITEVLEYSNAINCKSAFQPTIDAARAELEQMRAASDHMAACRALLNVPDDEVLYQAIDTLRTQLADQSAKMASLEAEAGVMREALRPFADAFTKIIKRGGERRREWNEDMPAHFPITLAVTMADGRSAQAALSTQAGIDPLKRMADLEGDKRRLDWLELQQVGCVPCWKDDERGELRHAGWITVAEEHQDRTFGIELVRSSVRDAIDAALSQEQATPRNV